MKLKVIEWMEPPHNFHRCEDKKGETHRVDLLVNGEFKKDIDPQALVGKTVNVDSLHAYCEIAMGVKILKAE